MGLVEHVERGWMSITDLGFYTTLHFLADPATGIVWTNAGHLSQRVKCSRELAKKYLRRLSTSNSKRAAYIRRFTVPHSHAVYPVLINRFECRLGVQRGKRLNALKTNDWRAPVWEGGTQSGTQSGTQKSNLGKEVAFNLLEPRVKSEEKPRAETPGAPSSHEALSNQQKRKIEARDRREQRENEVRKELRVGGPPTAEAGTQRTPDYDQSVQRSTQRRAAVLSPEYRDLTTREHRLLAVQGRIQRALASYEKRLVDPEVVSRERAELDAVKQELAEVSTQKRALLEKAGEIPPQKNT